ncbi:YtxH domain-containing protein [Weissella oryzae]|uniref:YtxH domain-containing protein n=1 Tax=Weissella oryzae TaxID=1129792 RepID=UPI000484D698|nr:YtxH domain-containing protein [Weissella oryzae]
MAKGLFTGLVLGATAATAGYLAYKALTPEQQANLRDKVDGVVSEAQDWVEPHVQTASEKITDFIEKADDFIEEQGYGDTRDQALEKLDLMMETLQAKKDELRQGYDDLKEQAREKMAPDLAEADINIVLDDTNEQSLSDALDEIYGADDKSATSVEPIELAPKAES